ncbi:tyrosine-type recombinase/integrase [Xylanimonas protaetiae]|uniref:tyrosine-type recombinase/integrase n=1 Tax=Xylanimonas protaetiae TaxID=2509457 RepID=UPI0013E9A113|nr:site-specific integrase [Xylanimonas protaetiae]
MSGSVRRLPSGRWQARYTDADDQRHTLGTYATRAEADGAVAVVLADMHRGTYRAPDLGSETLGDYAARWLARRSDLAPRTVQLYAHHLSTYVCARLDEPGANRRTIDLGAMELRALTPARVADWHAAVVATARATMATRSKRAATMARRTDAQAARAWARGAGLDVAPTGRLSPAVLDAWRADGAPGLPSLAGVAARDAGRTTGAQAYGLVRVVCNAAVREGLLVVNPCNVPGAGRAAAAERKPATLAQVDTIAEHMPPRYAAAVHVAAWSALRAGELFALRRQDVTVKRDEAGAVVGAVLSVTRGLIELKGQPPTFGPTKTRGSQRTVHLPRVAAEHLAAHLDTFTGGGADALVFCTATGRPLPGSGRQAFFTRARKAAGREDLRWHDLRHTGATWAARTGATLAELQARLGHSTVRAAMIYQHAVSDSDERLAARLDALHLDGAL